MKRAGEVLGNSVMSFGKPKGNSKPFVDPSEEWCNRFSTLRASPSLPKWERFPVEPEALWGRFLTKFGQYRITRSQQITPKCTGLGSTVGDDSWFDYCFKDKGAKSRVSKGESNRANYRAWGSCDQRKDDLSVSTFVSYCLLKKDQVAGWHAPGKSEKNDSDLSTLMAQGFSKGLGTDKSVLASIVSAYVEDGQADEAIKLYHRLRQSTVKPNDHLFVAVLKASMSSGDLTVGRLIHADVVACGLESNNFVASTLIDMYTKSGSLRDARQVFDRVCRRDVVTWSTMIAGYSRHGLGQDALILYYQMQQDGVMPDSFTFTDILKACGNARALQDGKQAHAQIVERGLVIDEFVASALVGMYAKCGSLEDARRVFDSLPSRTAVIWNTMLAGYSQHEMWHEVLNLHALLQKDRASECDEVTFASILIACGNTGAIQEGKLIHTQILERGLEDYLHVGSALVDMYAKCGSLEDARSLFERLLTKNVVTWNALINGYGHHNDLNMVIECFEEMVQQGVDPDAVTFLNVLVACCHVGLVEVGEQYFTTMEQYGISPRIEHYTCMVDLLGRSGRLADAEAVLLSMPFEPHSAGLRSLLSSCKTHHNVEHAKLCFDRLVGLEPQQAAGYVLMSDIYADASKWEDVKEVENMRKQAGVENMPAKATIEVNNVVHEFTVGKKRGDTSSKLRSLNLQANFERRMSEMNEPSSDSAGDEDALCAHAEKLALAFGLLNTPAGTTLRVVKNLRMCDHCHSGTKSISRIEKREIIIRDAHRVHHFKDGICSCGDTH